MARLSVILPADRAPRFTFRTGQVRRLSGALREN
jgi:hypothetical protein